MSLLKSLWLILTIRCEQSSQLASESLDRELTRVERWSMKGHELVCGSCRRFRSQLIALREAARHRRQNSLAQTEAAGLSAEQRTRIAEALMASDSDEKSK